MLFVADLLGLERRMPDGTIERYANNALQTATRNIQGLQPLGTPFSVAAFDSVSVVYGDVRGNSVRYLNWEVGSEQILGGLDVYDGAANERGLARRFRRSNAGRRPDGSCSCAATEPLRSPMPAVGGSDCSETSIEAMMRAAPKPSLWVFEASANTHRIAFVGNSFLWEYDRWSTSIPGSSNTA